MIIISLTLTTIFLLSTNKSYFFYWQDIAMATPKNKNEVLSQPIWNNRFLTVNKEIVYLPHWYEEGYFLLFNSFFNKFIVK